MPGARLVNAVTLEAQSCLEGPLRLFSYRVKLFPCTKGLRSPRCVGRKRPQHHGELFSLLPLIFLFFSCQAFPPTPSLCNMETCC